MSGELRDALRAAVDDLSAWLLDNTDKVFEEQPEIEAVRSALQEVLNGLPLERVPCVVWTSAETEELRRQNRQGLNYKLKGKTHRQCQNKAQKLKLTRSRWVGAWSAEEDTLLRAGYPVMPVEVLLTEFPGRTCNALNNRAALLKLKKVHRA